MKIILLLLILFPDFIQAQNLPTEDFIKSARSTVTMQHNEDAIASKGAYLYYNDSIVLLHMDGAANKTVYFKIFSKRFDDVDKVVVINCFDSTWLAKYTNEQLRGASPTLSIHIDYNTSMNNKKYVDVLCWFMQKDLRFGFGTDAQSAPKEIAAIKSKYRRVLQSGH